jgi:hypothetical protein
MVVGELVLAQAPDPVLHGNIREKGVSYNETIAVASRGVFKHDAPAPAKPSPATPK